MNGTRMADYAPATICLFTGLALSSVSCIDVHFDDATSGFFIKNSQQRTDEARPEEDELSSNLTVLRTSELISLKASYGPFLTRERVAGARTFGKLQLNYFCVKIFR